MKRWMRKGKPRVEAGEVGMQALRMGELGWYWYSVAFFQIQEQHIGLTDFSSLSPLLASLPELSQDQLPL